MPIEQHQDRTIAGLWESYERDVLLPSGMKDFQRQELRRAFYAGAIGLFALVHGLGEDGISEEAGMHVLDGVVEECKAYRDEVLAGRG